MAHFPKYTQNGGHIYCIISKQDNLNRDINFQIAITGDNKQVQIDPSFRIPAIQNGHNNHHNIITFEQISRYDQDLIPAMMRLEEFKNVREIKNCYEKLKLTKGEIFLYKGPESLNSILDIKELILKVRIDDSIKTIPECTFMNCSSLTEVIFSDSVLVIGAQAFKNCGELKKLVLPRNLVRIGAEAFKNCTNLRGAIEIPNSCTHIGVKAFEHVGKIHLNILKNRQTRLNLSSFDAK